jgi:hypothetical protein
MTFQLHFLPYFLRWDWNSEPPGRNREKSPKQTQNPRRRNRMRSDSKHSRCVLKTPGPHEYPGARQVFARRARFRMNDSAILVSVMANSERRQVIGFSINVHNCWATDRPCRLVSRNRQVSSDRSMSDPRFTPTGLTEFRNLAPGSVLKSALVAGNAVSLIPPGGTRSSERNPLELSDAAIISGSPQNPHSDSRRKRVDIYIEPSAPHHLGRPAPLVRLWIHARRQTDLPENWQRPWLDCRLELSRYFSCGHASPFAKILACLSGGFREEGYSLTRR